MTFWDGTVDHRPEDNDEKERIIKAGGRVIAKKNGNSRVYLSDVMAPGLMVSRSFGDAIAHTVGVSAEPTRKFSSQSQPFIYMTLLASINVVKTRHLKNQDLFLLVGSDGIWDMIPSKFACQLATPFAATPNEGVKRIQNYALECWKDKNNADNITLAMVTFSHQEDNFIVDSPSSKSLVGGAISATLSKKSVSKMQLKKSITGLPIEMMKHIQQNNTLSYTIDIPSDDKEENVYKDDNPNAIEYRPDFVRTADDEEWRTPTALSIKTLDEGKKSVSITSGFKLTRDSDETWIPPFPSSPDGLKDKISSSRSTDRDRSGNVGKSPNGVADKDPLGSLGKSSAPAPALKSDRTMARNASISTKTENEEKTFVERNNEKGISAPPVNKPISPLKPALIRGISSSGIDVL